MVKGNSRQVILVQSPDPKLFEQAIFILKEDAIGDKGITDEQLLREANCILTSGFGKNKSIVPGIFYAVGGAMVTGIIWFISSFI